LFHSNHPSLLSFPTRRSSDLIPSFPQVELIYSKALMAGKHVTWQKQLRSTVIQIPVALRFFVSWCLGFLRSLQRSASASKSSIIAQQSSITFFTLNMKLVCISSK